MSSSRNTHSLAVQQRRDRKQRQKQKQKRIMLLTQFADLAMDKMPSLVELAELEAQGQCFVPLGRWKWILRNPYRFPNENTHFSGYDKKTGTLKSPETGVPIVELLRGISNNEEPDPLTGGKTVLDLLNKRLLDVSYNKAYGPMVVRLVWVKGTQTYQIRLIWNIAKYDQEQVRREQKRAEAQKRFEQNAQ